MAHFRRTHSDPFGWERTNSDPFMTPSFAGGFTFDSVEFEEEVREFGKGKGKGKGKSKSVHIIHAEFEEEVWEFGKGGKSDGKCSLGLDDDDYMYMMEEGEAMARKGQGKGKFCDDDHDDYEMYEMLIGKSKGAKGKAKGKGPRSRSPPRLSHGLPASGSDEVNDETEMLRSTMGKGTEKGKGGGGRSSGCRDFLSRLFRRA